MTLTFRTRFISFTIITWKFDAKLGCFLAQLNICADWSVSNNNNFTEVVALLTIMLPIRASDDLEH